MLYQKEEEGIRLLEHVEAWDRERPAAGYLTLEEFAASAAGFGFPEEAAAACRGQHNLVHSGLVVYDDFSYSILPLFNIRHLHTKPEHVALFFRKNLLLLVELETQGSAARQIFEQVLHHVERNFSIDRMTGGLLMHWMQGSSEMLGRCEEQILELERGVLDDRPDADVNRKMFRLKRGLTLRRSYYEKLIEFGESLAEDENDLFDKAETFRYLQIAVDKAQHLSDNARMLCENLVHLREAYQSALDYNLNRIMKLFTAVTTIFLPLTLIAGWYGMNFDHMPELSWKYGYLGIILISAAVVLICLWIFRKKKFF